MVVVGGVVELVMMMRRGLVSCTVVAHESEEIEVLFELVADGLDLGRCERRGS